MNLMRILLTLARTEKFPGGSTDHGYEFIAPLTNDGHIDAAGWKEVKKACTVRRFWNGEPDKAGMLRHVGQGWRFDYDPNRSDDDEPFFKLDKHSLSPGAYVSVDEGDGDPLPFKVVSVIPVTTRVS
jgi:hypothetical protein